MPSDRELRRYMTLADKAQAGTADRYELFALGLLQLSFQTKKARWVKEACTA